MIAGFLALALAPLSFAPVVTLDTGSVRGEQTTDGRSLFRAIPFAAPPIGDLRWRAPAPAPAWTGIRDATRSAAACPQIDYGWNHDAAAHQSEDCLYLEVGTPALHPAHPLPVMVWIHGGGNRGGGGSGTISSHLVARGVVLVSLQYRLSALGFLSHPALGRTSGNYGLMDQQAALRWVRDNITAFGGDPGNVTIFGESAGAQDVGLQLLSPGGAGLFAKAIEQSGTPGFGTPPRSLAENERLGRLVIAQAGADPDADAATLRRIPAAALIHASDIVDVPNLDDDSFIWLQAVVDGTVLPEAPAASLARGGGAPVPLIIGNNARELPLYGGESGASRAITRAFASKAPAARAFYRQDRSGSTDARLGDRATRIADDINFRCPSRAVAADRTRAGLPTWHYEFDVGGPDGKPVAHGSDIRFVLGDAGAADTATAPLAAYWANFARTGDPNGARLPQWSRYGDARITMHFTESGPRQTRRDRSAICALRDMP